MEKIFEQIDNLFVNGVINGIISIVILKNNTNMKYEISDKYKD